MDFTSIKQEPIDTMLKGKASVIGLHPLFGKVETLSGKTIILVPARPNNWQNWIVETLKSANLKIKITDAKKHDKLMAILQASTHFNFIIFGKILGDLSEKFNISFEELMEYGGIIYQMRFGMIARLLSQDPELYGSIQMKNEYSSEIVKYYKNAVKELGDIIETKDEEAFNNYFKTSGDFFGEDFKEKSLNDSTELIEHISKTKNNNPKKTSK